MLRLLWTATLAALGVAAAYWMLEPAEFSPGETVAAIRRRPMTRPGDDTAPAIEQIASQILSPSELGAALRQARPASPQSEAERARSAEALRGRLRVDVDPGDSAGPWTITLRATTDGDAARMAAIVNALAERYCQESQATAVAREEHAYRSAQKAAEQARKAAEQARQELDRRLDRSLRLAESNRAPQVAAARPRPGPAATVAEESAPRVEALRQLAELEAGRELLLERLLPAHPDVQAIEAEIEAARAQLGQLPPPAPERAGHAAEAGAEQEAADSLKQEVAQAAAAVAEQRRLLAQAEQHARQLDATERQMAERLLLYARDRVAHVSSPASVAPLRSMPSQGMRLAALSVALLAGWLACRSRPHRPAAFHDLHELAAATGVPIVGVLSAEGRRSKIPTSDRPSAAA